MKNLLAGLLIGLALPTAAFAQQKDPMLIDTTGAVKAGVKGGALAEARFLCSKVNNDYDCSAAIKALCQTSLHYTGEPIILSFANSETLTGMFICRDQ